MSCINDAEMSSGSGFRSFNRHSHCRTKGLNCEENNSRAEVPSTMTLTMMEFTGRPPTRARSKRTNSDREMEGLIQEKRHGHLRCRRRSNGPVVSDVMGVSKLHVVATLKCYDSQRRAPVFVTLSLDSRRFPVHEDDAGIVWIARSA